MIQERQEHYNKGELLSLETTAYIIYLCQALVFLFGVTVVVGFIINYFRRDEARGTIYESHFGWQTKTFWITACVAIAGLIFILPFKYFSTSVIGLLILAIGLTLIMLRTIKGVMLLRENKQIENYNSLI